MQECSAAVIKTFAVCFVARSDQSSYFVLTASAEFQRQEDELQSLRTLLQESRRQHEDDLSQARRTYEDELNGARRKSEEEISSVRQKLLEDLDRVRRAKDEELEELQRQRIEDAKKSAAEQEAEMYELRTQWDEQMQELRGLHSEHVKEAAVKDQLVRELEQTKAVLQQREESLALLQANFEDERHAITQERMRFEEELSQVIQGIEDSDRNIGRLLPPSRPPPPPHVQQEELVMLHGTVRRKQEDEKRYLQQVQQLRDLISDKEEVNQVLAEQNIALGQEVRAKDDKIALLQSGMNETRDLRTLAQEHEVIVERLRAQVLGLQTENSRLKFAGDQVQVEVNKVGDEIRLQVMNLQQMATVLDAETQLSERYRLAMESQRLETDQIRSELFQIEQLSREQTAQTEHMRAELEECRAQLEQARDAAQTAESLGWDIAKQQEQLVLLRGVALRKDEENLRLESEVSSLKSQISELQSSLGSMHRELRVRDNDLNAISEDNTCRIKELKMRHEEDLAHLRQLQAESVEEFNRQSEGRMQEMISSKEEHMANLSGMRAKLNYEVENETLALKLLLEERTADLEVARKLLLDLEGSVQELELILHHVKLEAQEKEQDAEAVLQKAQQEAKEKIDLLESSALTLQEEVENKNTVIDSLQIDLDRLWKAIKDTQQEVGKAKAEHERDRKEWEAEREKTEAMMGDSRENHAMINFCTEVIENMRSELETARDSLCRKEEERQKLESQNILLLEVIGRKDQELENLDMEAQVVEELKHQLQKLSADAEKKHKAMKEVQSMMRGKAQLEKQGPPAM